MLAALSSHSKCITSVSEGCVTEGTVLGIEAPHTGGDTTLVISTIRGNVIETKYPGPLPAPDCLTAGNKVLLIEYAYSKRVICYPEKGDHGNQRKPDPR